MANALTNAAAYVWGNCTYFVAQQLPWIPAGLGNAKDWLQNAAAKGLPTSKTPRAGDVVVYGAGSGYNPQYGHVAIVQSVQGPGRFTVAEMNARGLDVVSTRVSGMGGVLGFIEPPGTHTAATGTAAGPAPGNSSAALNLNPLAIPGEIASSITAIPGAINTSVAAAGKSIADSLNPLNWLMTIWNDHLKGNMVRVVLVIVGVWILVIGLRMLVDSDDSSQQSSPVAAPPSKAPEAEAEEAAPEAAVAA